MILQNIYRNIEEGVKKRADGIKYLLSDLTDGKLGGETSTDMLKKAYPLVFELNHLMLHVGRYDASGTAYDLMHMVDYEGLPQKLNSFRRNLAVALKPIDNEYDLKEMLGGLEANKTNLKYLDTAEQLLSDMIVPIRKVRNIPDGCD